MEPKINQNSNLIPLIGKAFELWKLDNPRHPYKDFSGQDVGHLFQLIEKTIKKHRTGRNMTPDNLAKFFDDFAGGVYGKTYNTFSASNITEALNKYESEMRAFNASNTQSHKTIFDREYKATEGDRLSGSFATWLVRKSFTREPWQKVKDADKWLTLEENKDMRVNPRETLGQWMGRMIATSQHWEKLDHTVQERLTALGYGK